MSIGLGNTRHGLVDHEDVVAAVTLEPFAMFVMFAHPRKVPNFVRVTGRAGAWQRLVELAGCQQRKHIRVRSKSYSTTYVFADELQRRLVCRSSP